MVGVLALTNFGPRERLTVNGVPLGQLLPAPGTPTAPPAGSCIVVVLTDAPVDPAGCTRLLVRGPDRSSCLASVRRARRGWVAGMGGILGRWPHARDGSWPASSSAHGSAPSAKIELVRSANANAARAVADRLIAAGLNPWFAEYTIRFAEELVRQPLEALKPPERRKGGPPNKAAEHEAARAAALKKKKGGARRILPIDDEEEEDTEFSDLIR